MTAFGMKIQHHNVSVVISPLLALRTILGFLLHLNTSIFLLRNELLACFASISETGLTQ